MRFHICAGITLCLVSIAAAGGPTITPIKSVGELQVFLQQTPEFPLNCLSPDAKQRFFNNLKFNENGLAGISIAELSFGNFSAHEIQQIFALLGYPALQSLLRGARPPDQPSDCQTTQKTSPIGRSFDDFSVYVEDLWVKQLSDSAVTSSAAGKALAQKIRHRYHALFASELALEDFNETATSDLVLLFRAAYISSNYTYAASYRDDMLKILTELERRNAARHIYYSSIYDALIADRAFDQAREFKQAHPSFQANPLPEIQEVAGLDESKASVLVVAADNPALTRQNFDFDKSAQVVVIASPYCHFCENAIRDIQTDPLLREIFQAHASWLAPQEQGFDLAVYQQWSRDCPARMTGLIYRAEEWPQLAIWNTPTFYFFKQGEVVAKLSGWPEGGYREELLEGLRRIGLAL